VKPRFVQTVLPIGARQTSGYGCGPAMAQTQPEAVSSDSTWLSWPGRQFAAPSVVSHNAPSVLHA
jgi:hypothetical protein